MEEVFILMANIMPEEVLLDQAIEALEKYKTEMATGEPPQIQVMVLLMKWRNAGQEVSESIAEIKDMKKKIDLGNSLLNPTQN